MGQHLTAETNLALQLRKRHLTHRRVAFLLDSAESTVSNWSRGLVPNPRNRAELLRVLNEAGELDGLPPLTAEDLWGENA